MAQPTRTSTRDIYRDPIEVKTKASRRTAEWIGKTRPGLNVYLSDSPNTTSVIAVQTDPRTGKKALHGFFVCVKEAQHVSPHTRAKVLRGMREWAGANAIGPVVQIRLHRVIVSDPFNKSKFKAEIDRNFNHTEAKPKEPKTVVESEELRNRRETAEGLGVHNVTNPVLTIPMSVDREDYTQPTCPVCNLIIPNSGECFHG